MTRKAGPLRVFAAAFELPGLNHRVEVTGGMLAEECGDLLRAFFHARRG